MDNRIPLSVIFNTACRRDCIPHRTFTKPLSDSGFFQYLNSNDTRLPRHRLLDLSPLPSEEYDTLTGEDDWLKTDVLTSTISMNKSDSDDDDDDDEVKEHKAINISIDRDDNPRCVFDEVVDWVAETLEMNWACGTNISDTVHVNNANKDRININCIEEVNNNNINDNCHNNNTNNVIKDSSYYDESNDNGVVLCGRYVVADDCPWAVSSRSVQLYTVREVFMAMRSSCKFLRDIEHQLNSARHNVETREVTENNEAIQKECVQSKMHKIKQEKTCNYVMHEYNVESDKCNYMLEFTLAKAVSTSSSSEMRVFVPYRLTYLANNNNIVNNVNSTAMQQRHVCNNISSHEEISVAESATLNNVLKIEPLWDYAGVSQRITDVCFPALMKWDDATHHENFITIINRLKTSRLLEHAHEYNSCFITNLLETKQFESNTEWEQVSIKEERQKWYIMFVDDGAARLCNNYETPLNFFALLAVDVIFENPFLPIYILSAKVQLFKAKKSIRKNYYHIPLLEEEHDIQENGELCATSVNTNIDINTGNNESIDAREEEEKEKNYNENNNHDSNDVDDNETEFFRLFRDVKHWNYYIEQMQKRINGFSDFISANEQNSIEECNNVCTCLDEQNLMHFCVVASERNDLVQTHDFLSKRGLPLELRHPELLSHSPEVLAFVNKFKKQIL